MALPPLASFVADVERLLDDPHAVGARLGALLSQDGWLPAAHRIPDGDACRHRILHVSPSHRLSVVVLTRLPGRHTLVHDDAAWCVVGVYEGCERETRYRAVEGDGTRSLEEVASFDARAGHVE